MLGWVAAKDLVEEVDGDVAGRFSGGGVAMLRVVAKGFGVGELLHVGGDFVAEAGGEEFVAEGG